MNGNANEAEDVLDMEADEGVDLSVDDADVLNDGVDEAEGYEVDLEPDSGENLESLDGLINNIVTSSFREKQEEFRAGVANLRLEVDEEIKKLEEAETDMTELLFLLENQGWNSEENSQSEPQVPSLSPREAPSSSQTNEAPARGAENNETGPQVPQVQAQVPVVKRRRRRTRVVRQPRSFTPPPPTRGPASAAQAPFGHLLPEKPAVGDQLWAMAGSSLVDPWQLATLISYSCEEHIKEEKGKQSVNVISHKFSVKFQDGSVKDLTGKEVAQSTVSPVRLPVGTRVIAVYQEEGSVEPGLYYPGVVGETPAEANNNRYLVFFDDSYPNYVTQADLRLVYQMDHDVWKDVWKDEVDGNDLTEFLPSYLKQYPRRPMVKLKEGDRIKTATVKRKKKEIWVEAEINSVDCSLAQVVFEDSRIQDVNMRKVCELIYRGSPRFQPMRGRLGIFLKQSSEESQQRRMKPRAKQVKPVQTSLMEQQEFMSHDCGHDCEKQYEYVADRHRGSNPLRIPLHLGWRRKYLKSDDREQGEVHYIAPCGRKLRNIEEVQVFLQHIKSKLEIDFFAFDPWLDVMRQFIPEPDFIQVRDLSFGMEKIPVPAANSYSGEPPNLIQYSGVPVPQNNVHIETDPGFLVCCDCVGICDEKQDGKFVCPCRQLTVDSTPRPDIFAEAGYRHR